MNAPEIEWIHFERGTICRCPALTINHFCAELKVSCSCHSLNDCKNLQSFPKSIFGRKEGQTRHSALKKLNLFNHKNKKHFHVETVVLWNNTTTGPLDPPMGQSCCGKRGKPKLWVPAYLWTQIFCTIFNKLNSGHHLVRADAPMEN